jgi:hypothetical protein
VVGGAGSVVGAVLAALFLDRAPTFVTDVAHLDGAATNVFYGGLLILLMFVMPGVIVGLVAALRQRLSGLLRRRCRVPDAGPRNVPETGEDAQVTDSPVLTLSIRETERTP